MLLRRLARPLLASTFVANGVDTLMHPQSRVQEASSLVDKGQESLPSSLTSSLPDDPDTLVKVTAAVQIAGGALLALGKAPRPAAFALAATVVPGAVTEQNFWAETDPARKAAKRTAFLKDMGLLGGLMIASADTAGKPSLSWRGRRAARRTANTVGGALPVGAASRNGTGDAVREQLQHAAGRGQNIAGSAASKGHDLAGTVADKGAELAETARERGPGWAEAAKNRGAEWADVAKHRGSELADTAQDKGPVWADMAKTRAAEFADVAKHRGGELADVAKHRGDELADAAKHRGGESAGTARARRPDLAAAAKSRAAEIADVTKYKRGELDAAAKERRARLAKITRRSQAAAAARR